MVHSPLLSIRKSSRRHLVVAASSKVASHVDGLILLLLQGAPSVLLVEVFEVKDLLCLGPYRHWRVIIRHLTIIELVWIRVLPVHVKLLVRPASGWVVVGGIVVEWPLLLEDVEPEVSRSSGLLPHVVSHLVPLVIQLLLEVLDVLLRALSFYVILLHRCQKLIKLTLESVVLLVDGLLHAVDVLLEGGLQMLEIVQMRSSLSLGLFHFCALLWRCYLA